MTSPAEPARAWSLVSLAAVAALLLAPGCVSGQPATEMPIEPVTVAKVFGQAHTWPNGDTVTISNPVRRTAEFTPDNSLVTTTRSEKFIVVDVEIRNAGPEPKQVRGYVLYGAFNDTPANPVHVILDGWPKGAPEGFIAPGHTIRFQKVYAADVDAPARFQVQVYGEGFDPQRPPVFFEGTV